MEHLFHRLNVEQRKVRRGSFDAENYAPDFLTGRREKNEGQLETYLVENAHEAIINRERFELVQRLEGNIKMQKAKPFQAVLQGRPAAGSPLCMIAKITPYFL